MYVAPAAGPSFLGHLLIVAISAVILAGAKMTKKLFHKNV